MGGATKRQSDLPFAPIPLGELRRQAAHCRRCDLYKYATQTVFGEGPVHALVMLVGEQPGDREDIEGHPFVGPAGKLLDRALADAEVDRTRCYVTNAVKHFKNEPRGKRRLRKKPNAGEIRACHFWLEHELAALKPQLVVALGATAAAALAGRALPVLRHRGQAIELSGYPGMVTVHPSSLLREPDHAQAEIAYAHFVADLRKIRKRVPDLRG